MIRAEQSSDQCLVDTLNMISKGDEISFSPLSPIFQVLFPQILLSPLSDSPHLTLTDHNECGWATTSVVLVQ